MNNMVDFQTNSHIFKINTRHKHDLHYPNANLTRYHKRMYCTGIKLFSNLPSTSTSLNYDIKVFKPELKDFLVSHPLYSVEEFTVIENSCHKCL
jgi:hypothetical protein